jgi:hypothetical protein
MGPRSSFNRPGSVAIDEWMLIALFNRIDERKRRPIT